MEAVGSRYASAGAFALLIFSPTLVFAASPCPYVWNTNLSLAKTGSDVLALQQFLNQDVATRIAASGPGSPGLETSIFGGLTRKAVMAFQEKYGADVLVPNGLSSGNGFVGISTRLKLNALCAAGVMSSAVVAVAGVTVSSGLTVSTPEQPEQTIAPAGALYVPFTDVTVTAGATDVTIKSISVSRTGPSSNAAFIDIDLFDDTGAYLGIAYFDSNHVAKFTKPFVIPAGTTRTLSFVGDMAIDLSEHGGEMASLRVDSIEADAPVSGNLPITGTLQIMNSSLVIGIPTVILSPDDPRTSRTRYVNDTGIIFSSIRLSADSVEGVKLMSTTFRQSGTISPSDISNVQIIVQGVSYPATVDDRSYTAVFGDGIDIAKGMNADISIKGDITASGANRTVQFDIFDGGDIGLIGTSFGYWLFPIPGDNTGTSGNSVFLTEDGTTDTGSIKPYFVGSPVTISAGGAIYIGR